MAEARVKAGLWVRMALRLGDQAGRPGAVLRRGDADSGGVIVVLRGREGLLLLTQARGADGELLWLRARGGLPMTQEATDQHVAREVGRDPDLWVIEFDAPDLLPPFEARIS